MKKKVPINSGVKYFRSLLKGLPWYFPDKDLGKEILDFMPKCKLNARRLNRDGKIRMTTITTGQYITPHCIKER